MGSYIGLTFGKILNFSGAPLYLVIFVSIFLLILLTFVPTNAGKGLFLMRVYYFIDGNKKELKADLIVSIVTFLLVLSLPFWGFGLLLDKINSEVLVWILYFLISLSVLLQIIFISKRIREIK